MTDAAFTSEPRQSPRRRLVLLGVAVYCLLAWFVVFKVVGVGVQIARGGPDAHYAERTTPNE